MYSAEEQYAIQTSTFCAIIPNFQGTFIVETTLGFGEFTTVRICIPLVTPKKSSVLFSTLPMFTISVEAHNI